MPDLAQAKSLGSGQLPVNTAGGGVANYVYDLSGQVLSEYGNCQTCWNVGYIYLNGGLIAQYSSNTTYFFQSDHLGSTRLLIDLTGSVCSSIDYLPFGEYSASGTCWTSHRFTGKERDGESGLDNFGARYSSSQYGRFMTPDPMGGQLESPQTLNRYAYVRNNPVTLTDPTGLCDDMDDAFCTGDWGFGPGFNGVCGGNWGGCGSFNSGSFASGPGGTGYYCPASMSACNTLSLDGQQIDSSTAMNVLGTGAGAFCPAYTFKYTSDGLFAWSGMYSAITADYVNGSLGNVKYKNAHWFPIQSATFPSIPDAHGELIENLVRSIYGNPIIHALESTSISLTLAATGVVMIGGYFALAPEVCAVSGPGCFVYWYHFPVIASGGALIYAGSRYFVEETIPSWKRVF